jgi:hypothetical protein
MNFFGDNDRYRHSVLVRLRVVFALFFVSVFVSVSVYDTLAQRLMRLVLEEFAPAVKLGE